MKNVYITSATRTAVGSLNKSLKNVQGFELGSTVLKESMLRPNLNGADVDEVILDMILSFSLSPSFEIADGYTNGQPETLQLNTNPTPIQTEREISVQRRELPVYRMMFVKT